MYVEILSKNCCIIHTKEGEYLQSYTSIVGFKNWGIIILYPHWNYSSTTTKQVSKWLGLSSKEIKQKLKEDIIKYEDSEPNI